MRKILDLGLRGAAAIVVLFGLAACGTGTGAGDGDGDGGGGGGGGSGGVRDVGFVGVEESTSAASGTVVASNGGFARFDGDVPDAIFTDPWGDVVGTCDVFSAADIPDDPTFGIPTPDGLAITFLEAGASLSVTADGAAFLELDRIEASFGGQTVIGYTSGDEVAGTAGGDLALTVPGDEFPAVSDAAFPASSTFELTAPATPGAMGSVSEATTFTWSGATNDDATIVMIDLFSDDFMTSVSCTAPDTGTFELPAETVAELGGSFSGRVTSAGRESVRVETVGDARLLLSVSRSQTYDLSF